MKVTHIVNSIYASRSYLLINESCSEVWLVDCGDVKPLIDLISSYVEDSFLIKGVLLTHAHYDHMYGLPKMTDQFPEVKVYTNESGAAMLADERKNMSRYHEDPINYRSDNVVVCEDGDEIELFDDVKAVVHYTPGHNPSCLTFEVDEYLFTGDAYIPGLPVVTNLPGGEKRIAQISAERIQSLAEGKIVCPGHEVSK